MQDISRAFYLLAGIFLTIGLIANFLISNFPRLPGDILVDRPNIKIYIPLTSSLILSLVLSLLFNLFDR